MEAELHLPFAPVIGSLLHVASLCPQVVLEAEPQGAVGSVPVE